MSFNNKYLLHFSSDKVYSITKEKLDNKIFVFQEDTSNNITWIFETLERNLRNITSKPNTLSTSISTREEI